jgi:hypothetical protein
MFHHAQAGMKVPYGSQSQPEAPPQGSFMRR